MPELQTQVPLLVRAELYVFMIPMKFMMVITTLLATLLEFWAMMATNWGKLSSILVLLIAPLSLVIAWGALASTFKLYRHLWKGGPDLEKLEVAAIFAAVALCAVFGKVVYGIIHLEAFVATGFMRFNHAVSIILGCWPFACVAISVHWYFLYTKKVGSRG